MSVQINWYNPDRTIVSLRAERCPSLQTWFNAHSNLMSMLGTVSHEVDLIAQLENACPAQLHDLTSHLPALLNVLPPNLGLVVVIGNRLAWDLYLHACTNVHDMPHIDAEFADSLEQAHEFICNRQMSRLYSRRQA
jgi:hypothetical protein